MTHVKGDLFRGEGVSDGRLSGEPCLYRAVIGERGCVATLIKLVPVEEEVRAAIVAARKAGWPPVTQTTTPGVDPYEWSGASKRDPSFEYVDNA